MNINDYQKKCMTTAQFPNVGENIIYPLIGLVGEAGELANKYKKHLRGDYKLVIGGRDAHDLSKELGDVLWYVAVLADALGYTLEEIAKSNLEKLEKRQKQGTIKGSGDNR